MIIYHLNACVLLFIRNNLMHIVNILTHDQQQFQRVLFHPGCPPEDSNYVVTVGTLGGLLALSSSVSVTLMR